MWFKSQMIQFNRTRDDNTGVVWVMERRFIITALSAISIQEVQRVLNNLFNGCHGWLRVAGGHFQRLYCGGTSYVTWVIVRPLLVMRLRSVFSWTSSICVCLCVCVCVCAGAGAWGCVCVCVCVCVWTKLFHWGCEYFTFSACRIYLYPCVQEYHNMKILQIIAFDIICNTYCVQLPYTRCFITKCCTVF